MSFMSGMATAFGSIGGILNGLTGVTESQDRTYAQQRKTMNDQNAYNTYMWNKQNEYNSPVAQLARMREAGIDINPTSYALGTGNLSNTATFVGSENGFSGSGSPAGNPITMALGVANGISEIRNRNALTENLGVQNDNLKEQTSAISLDNSIKRHNLKVAQDTNMPVGETPDLWRVVGQKLSKYSKGDYNSLKEFGSDVYSMARKFSESPVVSPGTWAYNKIKNFFR